MKEATTPTPFFAFLDDKFNGVMHQFWYIIAP